MCRKFSRQFDMTFSKKTKRKEKKKKQKTKEAFAMRTTDGGFTVCDMLFGRKRRERIGQYVS